MKVNIQEQPFQFLVLFLERPGTVLSCVELRARLWPDGTFVDFEHSVNAAVKRLRDVLGDDADNPRFIETIPRRGYKFIALSLQEFRRVNPVLRSTRQNAGYRSAPGQVGHPTLK
jgi:DNA-binding winged helix-turn-helix (wHTH) protein